MFFSRSLKKLLLMLHAKSEGDPGCILDHPLLSKQLFFPRKTEGAGGFPVECDGARLDCRLRAEHPGAGYLLHFHGNGELAARYEQGDFADMIVGMGLNVCFAEYRGYGASTGEPALVRMLGDGERILKALGVPPEQVVVYGRSMGSLYAAELAKRCPQIGGLVLESGIADLLERILTRVKPEDLGVSEAALAGAVSRHFDQRRKLRSYTGPLLVLHARHDGMIDPSHAQRFHQWSRSLDKKLILFQEGNHNSLIAANLAAYQGELSEFLKRTGVLGR